MKKIGFLLLFIGVLCFTNSKAQNTNAIFGDDVVWYGLDFSNAKFVGQFTNLGDNIGNMGYELKNKFIPQWNMLILNEPKKYDIRKNFRKANVYNQLDNVTVRNSKLDAEKLTTYNTYTFTNSQETIEKIVKEYDAVDKKEGLGLVFIVESFDKMANLASVYVTFFDIATKKVLLTEKFVEAPVGVGVRNYWAGAIAKIFKQVGMYKMNEWKSKSK
jgi:hypothetical protein